MTITSSIQAIEITKKLPLCSDKPNCVSSQAEDKEHYILPFKIKIKQDEAWSILKQELEKTARTEITHLSGEVLHAKLTSLIFRFVDDVYVILARNENIIHISSASRVGYSDFGVNRKRVESLRINLQQAGVIE